MVPTLLFDMDGTLVVTDPLHFEAFRQTFAPHGIDVDWATYRARLIGRANADIALDFLGHLPADQHAAILDGKEATYRTLIDRLEPAPGLLELLAWADAAGVPCAVVTNAPRENAVVVLRAIGLETRFRALIVGTELAHAKPHALPYLAALEALGGDRARSVAFEDSPAGVRSARAAGLKVVGFTTSLDPGELLAEGVDVEAADYRAPAVIDLVRTTLRLG